MLESGLNKSKEVAKTGNINPLIEQLSRIVNQYLMDHPGISLNGLSKQCRVSEPTIRRISKCQIKTNPNVSTVLDLLTTISGTKEVHEIVNRYPGAVADFIKDALPHLEEQKPEYSHTLNSYLQDPTRYLVFKLALNRSGVTVDKIRQLFGEMGVIELNGLVKQEIVEERVDGRYHAKIKHYHGDYDTVTDRMKAVLNFLKTEKVQSRMPLNPLFVNGSNSVSEEAYKEVSKIQRAAFKKISQILSDDGSDGPIPLFYLCAMDTLDIESAYEITQNDPFV